MNAVIALCHFCELHGPSILFCTQPFHCVNHTPEEVERGGVEASPSACGISFGRLHQAKNKDDANTSQEKVGTSRQFTCEACRSLGSGEPGLISINKESHISYISMQHPEEQELYSVLRHACVRSLSCEVCPGREGPIMFGDEASGYVFSYTFFLKDMQSRGFQRWFRFDSRNHFVIPNRTQYQTGYSVICVMMDRIYLVNTCPFLKSNFKGVIDELQAKADVFYKNEQASAKPQRDSLIQARNVFLAPDQFRRGRGGLKYRSLHHITNEKDIFERLHERFSWILQACAGRFTEKLLEGPPLEDYLNDGGENHSTMLPDFTFGLNAENNEPVFLSVRHLFKVLDEVDFRKLGFHVVRGDQIIVHSDIRNTTLSLFKVLKELIPAGCFQCISFANVYQESWRCNFLGLPKDAVVPEHIKDSPLYARVVIEMKEYESSCHSTSHFRTCENSFSSCNFNVHGHPVNNAPSYFHSLMEALLNRHVNDDLFCTMLQELKEKWIGKAKVMFRFSRSAGITPEEKQKVLRILHARENDEILLKYWMTSFSRSYRSHLLNSEKPVDGETTT